MTCLIVFYPRDWHDGSVKVRIGRAANAEDMAMPRISAALGDDLINLPLDRGMREAVERRRSVLCDVDCNERDLLMPDQPGPVSVAERRAIAVYVAALHREQGLVDRYLALLADSEGAGPAFAQVIAAEARRAGALHPAPHLPAAASRALIGDRLAVIFRHLQALLTGDRKGQAQTTGWDADALEIVSRIVTLVIFRTRMIAGLRQFCEDNPNVVPLARKGAGQ